MNFSGEVIVVYVSHSPGGEGTERDEVFRNPVQEEASEAARRFQGAPGGREDYISRDASQAETLPVQEVMER